MVAFPSPLARNITDLPCRFISGWLHHRLMKTALAPLIWRFSAVSVLFSVESRAPRYCKYDYAH